MFRKNQRSSRSELFEPADSPSTSVSTVNTASYNSALHCEETPIAGIPLMVELPVRLLALWRRPTRGMLHFLENKGPFFVEDIGKPVGNDAQPACARIFA